MIGDIPSRKSYAVTREKKPLRQQNQLQRITDLVQTQRNEIETPIEKKK